MIKFYPLFKTVKEHSHKAAYQINHPLIIQNLAKKENKGVLVEVIGDAKNDKKGRYQALRERSIPVISGNRSGLMHAQICPI